ncbi:MAG: hypothetical protein ACE365_02195 [Gammaproteobacteria bacterium]
MDTAARELEHLFNQKAVWLGETPPINADPVLLNPEKNFRAESDKHGTYSVAWIYEHQLFNSENWPLLLDEAICLLKESGTLVCRIRDNLEGTVIELKSYLHRNPCLNAQLSQQFKTEEGETICVFDIARNDFARRYSRDWSIGILTNGKKTDTVVALIEKAIHLSTNDMKIEFIVAGPFEPNLTSKPHLVKVVNTSTNDSLARISEKKFNIAANANLENVAIFHDRYLIEDNFFEGFNQFGYDFNFLTISQSYEDGSFFPGYAALSETQLKWKVPMFHKNPGKLFPGHYINGGVMIFKKTVLEKIQLNPLLLHNEAEDVEMSFVLRTNGVIPRINIFSSAITVGIPNTYTSVFIDLTNITPPTHPHILTRAWRKLPPGLQKFFRGGRVYEWFRTKVG